MIFKLLDEPMPVIGTSNLVRNPGMHLSDVLRYISTSLGRNKGDG